MLKIKYKRTDKKYDGDRLILVETTDGDESVSIFRIGLLLNQLGINELNIKKKGNFPKFLYKEFIDGTLEHIKKGIDWAEPENLEKIEELCGECYLSTEQIDYDLLRRTQQRKLKEFEG